ncbi:MAG: hypothetical protein WC521_01210 [Bdellovibrionales bacterium]|jgi:uncharacterized membrane protein
MIDFRPHRVWIGLLVLAVLLGAGNAPFLGIAQQKAEAKRAKLQKENKETISALQQLREDITTAEKMKTEIDETLANKFLAPVDRLRSAQILERRAAESGLTHFSYTLSPEEKTFVDTLGVGKQALAVSQWSITADAPTDVDAFAFLEALRRTLPGRVTLHRMSLQRTGRKDAPISGANIRLTASGEWLSNGASFNIAEKK